MVHLQLNDAEHESDLQQVKVRRQIFECEGDLDPVNVYFLYKVIDLIGELSDDAQTLGNRMMYLLAN